MAKIDKEYHAILLKIALGGFKYEDTNRKDVFRYQIPSYTFRHDFKDGFPAITTKKLYWKAVVGELLWFLRGDTNIKYLVDNSINIWNKDAYNYYKKNLSAPYKNVKDYIADINNNEPNSSEENNYNLGRIYGAQWRNWGDIWAGGTIDQISNLIKGLKKTPMGTRHIVTAWNPAELDDMALPPCHWSFEVLVEPLSLRDRTSITKTRYISSPPTERELDRDGTPKYQFTLKWHQRSVDTFLGLPFNIASYALLAHIIGKMTNMVPKGIIGDLSNVHIYEPHMPAVKLQLSRSTSFFNSACELQDFSGFKIDMRNDFNQWINSKQISDFNLTNHSEQPAIKADMLPYNK